MSSDSLLIKKTVGKRRVFADTTANALRLKKAESLTDFGFSHGALHNVHIYIIIPKKQGKCKLYIIIKQAWAREQNDILYVVCKENPCHRLK